MIDTFSCIPTSIYFVKNSRHNVGFVIVCPRDTRVACADCRELTVYLSRGTEKWFFKTYNNQVNLCSHTIWSESLLSKGISRKIVCYLSEHGILWLAKTGMRRNVTANFAHNKYKFSFDAAQYLTCTGKSHIHVWISHLRQNFLYQWKWRKNVRYARNL